MKMKSNMLKMYAGQCMYNVYYMYVCMCACMYASRLRMCMNVRVYIHVCMCVYMYICRTMYVCIHAYTMHIIINQSINIVLMGTK